MCFVNKLTNKVAREIILRSPNLSDAFLTNPHLLDMAIKFYFYEDAPLPKRSEQQIRLQHLRFWKLLGLDHDDLATIEDAAYEAYSFDPSDDKRLRVFWRLALQLIIKGGEREIVAVMRAAAVHQYFEGAM
jgi:hypothetical protein